MLKLAAATIAAIAIAGPALAYQPTTQPQQIYINVGLGFGTSSALPTSEEWAEITKPYNYKDYEAEKGGMAGQIGVGYLFNFRPNIDLGAEVNYFVTKLGRYKASNAPKPEDIDFEEQFSTSGLSVLGVVKYHFSNQWFLLAKAGLTRAKFKIDVRSEEFGDGAKFDYEHKYQIKPILVAGFGYNFNLTQNTNFDLGLSINHLFGSKKKVFELGDNELVPRSYLPEMTNILLTGKLNFGL